MATETITDFQLKMRLIRIPWLIEQETDPTRKAELERMLEVYKKAEKEGGFYKE